MGNTEKVDYLSTNIRSSIDNIAKKEGFVNHDIIVRPICTNGGNYLGELFEVDIVEKDSKDDKVSHIFIKKIMKDIAIKVFDLNKLYSIESFIYNELYNVFNDLQDDANVPVSERYNMVKGHGEYNPEAVILENVAIKGYKTINRMEVVSLKQAKLSVEQLARFHGLSFALQELRPKYFEEKIKTIKSPFDLEELSGFLEMTSDCALKCLKGEFKKKFQIFVENITERYGKYIYNDTWTTNVLTHGDYRISNLFVREVNGEVVDVIPLDYQLVFYNCPIYDFLFFIFTSTDQRFRKEHLNYLKDLYMESLGKFLKFFNIDSEKVYPKKLFEEDYKKCLPNGMLIAIHMLPLCLVVEHDVPSVGEDLNSWKFNLDEVYEKRIQEIVEDFIEWGYL